MSDDSPSREQVVRKTFADQAYWCGKLGSPFTGMLCQLLADRLDRSTGVGRAVLDFPGDPGPTAGALPMRITGTLHAMVMNGSAPGLAALYPPNPVPDAEALWAAIHKVLVEKSGEVLERLKSAPQTNETARSSAIWTALLHVTDRFDQPVDLYELGCSAGLNLNMARFAYDLGGLQTGEVGSKLKVAPQWKGSPPPDRNVRVQSARGVDLAPLRIAEPKERELLEAYIWADQTERLERVRAAIEIALAHPPHVETGDAADWLEKTLTMEGTPGVTRVVYHTIAFQYFPPETKRRVVEHIARVGAAASEQAPLAWARLEIEGETENSFPLRLTLWPGGEERVIGMGNPHAIRFHHY